jgi:hypothetical protein
MGQGNRRASDVFVECLEAEGVKYVFGIPGEETLDLTSPWPTPRCPSYLFDTSTAVPTWPTCTVAYEPNTVLIANGLAGMGFAELGAETVST